MRLSFDDEKSFKETVESLRFDNHSEQLGLGNRGSSSIMPLEDSERNKDNTSPSDPITLWRLGSSSSVQEIRRSEDSKFSR